MLEQYLHDLLKGLSAKPTTCKSTFQIYNQIKDNERIRVEYRQPRAMAVAIIYLASAKRRIETSPARKKYYIRRPWTASYLAKASGSSTKTVHENVKLINSIISKSSEKPNEQSSTGTTESRASYGSGVARY